MKYLVVLGDGMADKDIEELGNKTPLEYAKTPTMDKYSKMSEIGLVHTIPEGMTPGSDTANLSVLGYDPKRYYTGRSPLEALSIGVDMKATDVALRCNIVTVSIDDLPYEEKTIIDHSSSEISTEDAAILLEAVKKELETDVYKFYVGTSYRHLTIWDKGEVVDLTAPHDVLGQAIGQYLPKDVVLREMMKKSYDILSKHPINQQRVKDGLNPANSLWFWGAGTRPMLSSFEGKTGKKGAMISAVDLLKGIAIGADMKVVEVDGANGGLNTNYEGKADAAVKVLLEDGYDFAYIHIEAPDEMGHQGSVERKVKAIEYLDERVIKRVIEAFEAKGEDFRMIVLPDHPTPIGIRTHTSDPVPYMLYDSTDKKNQTWNYNEKEAEESGNYIADGHTVINHLFKK
ncbi:cofactor-independent phosphoglycerate mutase [[Clostridium] fimetarium]|uniref:2,3-bisphosphoglycerate-independent phosphoglycerate mutase n=1 Tax=[Clostridium] fimetarium TaxID=99656 RepID=A0A1I0R8B2_9FIRM|nr:cofactor-independent phosphoglycerate mutase [[Clostridium] fimetarium]SEW36868.1 2,3-bisphosphoglycerate-independent phosphoglycerate mutase [[Clostridium] fimetarium]